MYVWKEEAGLVMGELYGGKFLLGPLRTPIFRESTIWGDGTSVSSLP